MPLSHNTRGWLKGSLLGLALCVPGALVPAVQGWTFCRRAHCCWNLIPVIVAARDPPAGTLLHPEDVSQRAPSEGEVDFDHVKPESAQAVFEIHLLAPVPAGEPLRWSFLRPSHPDQICELSRSARKAWCVGRGS